jgi:hypothetical protein
MKTPLDGGMTIVLIVVSAFFTLGFAIGLVVGLAY